MSGAAGCAKAVATTDVDDRDGREVAGQLVSVIFTGGTISSVGNDAAGGAIPTLTGSDLLLRVGVSSDRPRIRNISLEPRPSSHFSFRDALDINRVVQAELADESVSGVVVVQGTDVMEETSFLFDLLHAGQKPIIVTGSMRTADDPDYDGPANLADAIACAASDQLWGRGAVVVMAGSIEAADDVMKTHSTRLDTFHSPNFGSLGSVCAGSIAIRRPRGQRRHLDSAEAAGPVFIVEAGLDVRGETVSALSSLGPAGLVVKATGSGNTHPALLDACRPLLGRGVPVVLTTRAAAGGVNDTYAFPGGGGTWLRAGAIRAGLLPASKVRVALALGLGAKLSLGKLQDLLADPGQEDVSLGRQHV